MDTSDFSDFGDAFELGAGLAMGGILSRNLYTSLAQGIDTRTAIHTITIPNTAPQIQALLDQLDVRLANGQLTEATYNHITAKWQARLDALQNKTP